MVALIAPGTEHFKYSTGVRICSQQRCCQARACDGWPRSRPGAGCPLPSTRRARARRRVRLVRHGTGAGQREHRQMPPQRHPGCNRGPGRAGADGAGARPASQRHRRQPARRSAVRQARRGAARREHHFFSRREPAPGVSGGCGAPVGACTVCEWAAELERWCRQREQWWGVRSARPRRACSSCSPAVKTKSSPQAAHESATSVNEWVGMGSNP